ncbi:hypothetical protein ACP70R_006553 [Stipagrostis hirtigluma subsp. patula]
MSVCSWTVRLVLFLLCTICQRYALLPTSAAPAPTSNRISAGHSTPAAHGRRSDLVNTTAAMSNVTVPPMEFFRRAPPPLWSKAKVNWPAMDSFAPSRSPKYEGDVVFGNDTSSYAGRGDNRTSHASMASSSSSASSPAVSNRSATKCSGVVVVVVACSALLLLLCTLAGAGLLMRCVHRKRRGEIAGVASDPEDDDGVRPVQRPQQLRRAAGPRPYSHRTLAAAVGNFAESRRIGRGGFGHVYDGYLDDQERHVAVKVFSAMGSSPEQGRREFEAEVDVMSRLRHRNVVQLVGWCDGKKGLLLAYELAPGGSLHKNLYDPERILTWPQRYRIALGLGAAILYLHTEREQCVVHGDIKPSNVMLDASRDAKPSDFGLARLVDHGAEPRTTQVVAGTAGYIDPEFVVDRRRGPESDVYSFGVVLLEIACGGRPAASGRPKEEEVPSSLLKRVRDAYGRNAVLDAADGRLDGAFEERQMERVLVTGLWCADRDRSRRPSIAQAMDVLRSDDRELPVLPAAAGLRSGTGGISVFEELVYGDLWRENDGETTLSFASTCSTAYLSPENSGYLPTEEE